ncbi:putative T7SS-secreted protein [Streptomyces sp. P17]|uniref:putative T7SS-secreted protein n=1 Tax=Streptomyces sp. P17 TaxID=3074716 RepID=UPI0028F430E3|nr:hypothetical protein [Streptomyces sp. P17]MDT9697173.1 hypothetical protein [Streptomyces sp. P17]
MARPADWSPLAEADPVPGAPEGIRDEVEHMKSVAKKLRDQAAALQAIADSDGLKGKYADKIGEKAGGLSKRLDLAEDRYREVKGHLKGWADDMEEAQKKADRALRDAKDAQQIIDSRKPDDKENGSGKDGSGAESDDPAVKQAKEDLESARTRLNSAVSFYDERAGHYAREIGKSIDDDMEDSWWNDIKAWVGDAEWLDKLADKLSDISTVVGMLAVVFPALGPVAAALAGVVAVIHLVKALTGNGSWFDVLLDVAALKMMRNGLKAAKAIKGLQNQGRSLSQGLAKQKRALDSMRASRAQRAAVRGRASRLHRSLDVQRGRAAARGVRDEPLPEVTRKEVRKTFGDPTMAKQIKDIRRWRDEFPDSQELRNVAGEAEHHLGVQRASWLVGSGLDLADKGGEKMTDSYGATKDNMSVPVGSQW